MGPESIFKNAMTPLRLTDAAKPPQAESSSQDLALEPKASGPQGQGSSGKRESKVEEEKEELSMIPPPPKLELT